MTQCHGVVESDAVDVDDQVLCADAAAEPEVQAETDAEQHTEPTRIDEVDDWLIELWFCIPLDTK